ncbi:hypothetical protein [Alcaligenes faecalis]|uniref:hypothetical protein n=1 Tax=Alcaligenes faecalis TaxID=511 RepID=UPI0034D79F03
MDIKNINGSNDLMILQNKSDSVFIDYHVGPYVKHRNNRDVGDLKSFFDVNTAVVFGDWGDGHVVAPVEFIKNIFKFYEYKGFSKKRLFDKNRILDLEHAGAEIVFLEDKVLVKLKKISEPALFAFYVYKNKDIIKRVMYGAKNFFELCNLEKDAQYRVDYFIKFKSDGFIVRGVAGRFSG